MRRDPHTAQARPADQWGAPGNGPLPPHLDPLTQVLEGIRLRCMAPGAHEMTAPWGLRFGGMSRDQMRRHAASIGLLPPPGNPPEMRGSIVAVIRGSCCLSAEECKARLALSGGDVVLLTRKEPFTLRNDWKTPTRNVLELIRREDLEQLRGLRYGGGGAPTTFLAGAFFFEDDEDHPLLGALPPVIHIRSSESEAAPWLEATLKFLMNELAMRPPGSQSIVNHLAHILFVQAVRAYAASLPADVPGNWFGAILDSELAPALGLMHQRPEERWTVARLAEHINASRSSFAARFTAAVGKPPLQYLTECRMRTARSLLRDSKLGVKLIAAKAGYANESAFSHAFRRATGVSPGAYRRAKAEVNA